MSDHADKRDTQDPFTSALAYANAGIYVFPVYVKRKPDGKKDVRPAVLWRQASTTSAADIAAWWGPDGEHRNAGLGIDTGRSGLVVIDCDGETGIGHWHTLEPAATATVLTLNGGEHWYYRAHPDHIIGNDQDGTVAPSVDVRGLGGFVIAPPTAGYEWLKGPAWTGLPTVPTVVIDRMKAKRSAPPSSAAAPVAATEPEAPGADDFFDEPAREFTDPQAMAFIRDALAKLGETRTGFNGAINAFAMACAHFPWLVDRARCARLAIKALAPATGWTAPDADDLKTINSAYTATEQGRSWTAVKVNGPAVDDASQTATDVLPPPGHPLAVARELVQRMDHTEGELHRAWWAGDFYAWTGTHWALEDVAALQKWLYLQTEHATYLAESKDGEPVPKPWAPTPKKIDDLAKALGVAVLQRFGDPDVGGIATATGVLDAATRTEKPHAPSRFNLHAVPFGYDPGAPCPGWMGFLEDVLPGDTQAHDFLAEWFGYVLSGRTHQQKMATIVGKRRSGKGTIARVLTALCGQHNVAGLNLSHLGGAFGLEPLIGKMLAVAGDVRWNTRTIGDAVPVLLEVVGEDMPPVARKNRTNWSGRLGARIMLLSNETPTFTDRSGALSGRMVVVKLGQSFYGREDTALTDKLLGELPGILNWALDGLERLTGRGSFTIPESGAGEAESMRRLSDPIGTFLDDWCHVDPAQTISLDHLFVKYQGWCESEGRKHDWTTKEVFARDLRQKVPDLTVDRVRVEGKRVQMLKGVGCTAV
jgi:putative DNA primase/helicase